MNLDQLYRQQKQAYLERLEKAGEVFTISDYTGKEGLSLQNIAGCLMRDFDDSGITRIAFIPEQHLILSTVEAADSADILKNAQHMWHALVYATPQKHMAPSVAAQYQKTRE